MPLPVPGMFLGMSVTQPLLAERYRLVRSLGQGGMGRVWLARDEVLHRDVAIKEVVPPAGLTPQERDEMRTRTLREARAAARLNHPSVVRVYDVVRTDVHPWIVMEYVRSRSLHQVISEDGPLPPNRVAQIGLQVLGALRAAHLAGVTHRDVKPSNVLLTDEGRVVLTDFGLATLAGEATVTRPGMVLGSPAYISPERAREGYAGPESDLWSLGATLYAAVEGTSPYQRSSAIETLTALVTEEVPAARGAGPLRPVLNGLLRKDPKSRIDAEEAERLLRRAAGGRLASRLWLVPKPRPSAAGTGPAEPVAAPAPQPPSEPAPQPPSEPAQKLASEPMSEPVEAGLVESAAGPAARSAAPAAPSAPVAPSAPAAVSGPAVVAPAGSVAPEATVVIRPSTGERTAVVAPAKTSAEQTATQRPPAAVPARASGEVETGGVEKIDRARSGEPLRSTSAARGALVRTVRRPWLLAAAAVVALLVVAIFALSRGGGSSDTAHTPSAKTTKPSTGSAVPAVPPGSSRGGQSAGPGGGPAEGAAGAPTQPTPAAPVMLAGWHMYTDPTGFSVAVPDGWTVSHEGTILYYRDPNSARIFGIDQSNQPNGDPVADWTDQRNRRVPAGDFPGYQEVGIRPVNYWKACADWEFSYDRGGGRTHAINRGFVTSDHQAYGIWWSTPESSWQDDLKYFELITSTFKPKP
ncbi:MAG: protein kinase [Dactylosporangium sp.]|jgi:hypothetical protein|nr:protein kinase [Dactylosporangium sp.]